MIHKWSSRNTKHTAVNHNHHFKLESSCKIYTANLLINTGQDFNLDPTVRSWPTNWKLSQLLFELSPVTLESHALTLNLASKPPSLVRDLRHLIDSQSGTAATWTIWLALVLVKLLAYLCWIKVRPVLHQYFIDTKTRSVNGLNSLQIW